MTLAERIRAMENDAPFAGPEFRYGLHRAAALVEREQAEHAALHAEIERAEREQLRSILTEPITWEGDLDDDCVCRWRGMMGRAECMSDSCWFAAVYDQEGEPNCKVIFHDSQDDVLPKTGPAARKLVEGIMRLEAMTRELAGAKAGVT